MPGKINRLFHRHARRAHEQEKQQQAQSATVQPPQFQEPSIVIIPPVPTPALPQPQPQSQSDQPIVTPPKPIPTPVSPPLTPLNDWQVVSSEVDQGTSILSESRRSLSGGTYSTDRGTSSREIMAIQSTHSNDSSELKECNSENQTESAPTAPVFQPTSLDTPPAVSHQSIQSLVEVNSHDNETSYVPSTPANGQSSQVVVESKEVETTSDLNDGPECCRCRENFNLSLSPTGNGMIRPLPCRHLLCQSCINYLVTEQHVLVCPVSGCRIEHNLSERGSDFDTASQWSSLESRPPSPRTMVKHSDSALLEKMKVNGCSKIGCEELPTHICLDGCGLLCILCDTDAHQGLYAEHKRETIADQQLKKQRAREVKKKQRADDLKSANAQLFKIQSSWISESSEAVEQRLAKSKAFQAHFDAQSTRLKELKTQLVAWEEELKQQQKLYIASMGAHDDQLAALRALVELKNREFATAAQLGLEQTDDKFEKLIRLDEVTEVDLKLKTSWNQVNPTLKFYPSSELVQQLLLPTLLPSLTPELRDILSKKFLKESGKSLDNANLLYLASLHGWTRQDFLRQCLGKSHTLILIKVVGNEYLFGAYIAPEISTQVGGVPDPTKKSFLFSLINQARCPFRLSLTDSASSIGLSRASVSFGYPAEKDANGKTIKYRNFALFDGDKPANHPQGNFSNHHNYKRPYQLEEEAKSTLPQGFKLDRETLGGSQYFGASEIEVYQL